jgi:hypothetical protein
MGVLRWVVVIAMEPQPVVARCVDSPKVRGFSNPKALSTTSDFLKPPT